MRFWGSTQDKFEDPSGDRQMTSSTLTKVVIPTDSHLAASN